LPLPSRPLPRPLFSPVRLPSRVFLFWFILLASTNHWQLIVLLLSLPLQTQSASCPPADAPPTGPGGSPTTTSAIPR
jgi:hypothetical protein